MQILDTSALANRAQALMQTAAQAHATSGTNSTTGYGSTTSSTSSVGSLTSEQTFLQLLVAQIQNQDPLNPTDSIQFVGQLVQYSELEHLMEINKGVQTPTRDSTPKSSTSSSSSNGSTNPTSSARPTTLPTS